MRLAIVNMDVSTDEPVVGDFPCDGRLKGGGIHPVPAGIALAQLSLAEQSQPRAGSTLPTSTLEAAGHLSSCGNSGQVHEDPPPYSQPATACLGRISDLRITGPLPPAASFSDLQRFEDDHGYLQNGRASARFRIRLECQTQGLLSNT